MVRVWNRNATASMTLVANQVQSSRLCTFSAQLASPAVKSPTHVCAWHLAITKHSITYCMPRRRSPRTADQAATRLHNNLNHSQKGFINLVTVYLMKSVLAASVSAGLPNISPTREALPHWYRRMQNVLIEKTQFCKGSAQGGV